eukprot:6134536-Pleurochrysis_carterae.AAC.1
MTCGPVGVGESSERCFCASVTQPNGHGAAEHADRIGDVWSRLSGAIQQGTHKGLVRCTELGIRRSTLLFSVERFVDSKR